MFEERDEGLFLGGEELVQSKETGRSRFCASNFERLGAEEGGDREEGCS